MSMRWISLVLLCCGLTTAGQAQAPSSRHAEFTVLLAEHVHDGRVDYAALRTDPRLQRYTDALSATDPATLPTREERMAFWFNVYNAFTLRLIVEHYPLRSINELHFCSSLYLGVLTGRTVWRTYRFPIAGRQYTLDDVEHTILRREYPDFRLHAAVVCASHSCPILRPEAYEGASLDAQLTDQMRVWLADPRRNRYDPATHTLYLSKIFDWYEDDFRAAGGETLDALLPYFSAEVRAALHARRSTLTIEYLEYDWSLNDR